MKISLETLKNMSERNKSLHQKLIRKFLFKLSPTELRQAQAMLHKEPKLTSRISKNINKPFKVIKSKKNNLDKRAIHITKIESDFFNCNSQNKLCTKCKKFKLLSEFPKHSNCCKDCKKLLSIDYDVVILEGDGKECKQCLDFKKWEEFCYCNYSTDKKSIYCRECRSLNIKLRLWTNINARLSSCLRKRIHSVLKGKSKASNTINLIGCSIDYLKIHIENRFQSGMSWDNYGRGDNGKQEWHVDHIIPCCKFDLTKEEEQRKCFHYNNLQPLWAVDNIKKGGK